MGNETYENINENDKKKQSFFINNPANYYIYTPTLNYTESSSNQQNGGVEREQDELASVEPDQNSERSRVITGQRVLQSFPEKMNATAIV